MANRYWVGNTGLWDDTDHWSLTSGGVGGASIPTINDDVFIDANSFTEPGQYIEFGTPDCSNSETIGYTTLQMATSGTQTLTVTGGAVGDVYTWTTTSGSFDTSTGTSVVYTAPATNAECANNPTISLTCGGNVVDTIQIAVNAHSGTEIAYEEWINRTCDTKTYWTECCVTRMRYFCNGTVDTNPNFSNCTICATSQETHPPPQNPTPTDCATCYSAPLGLGCGSGGRSINTVMALPNDVRPEWLKNAGCCPAQLL